MPVLAAGLLESGNWRLIDRARALVVNVQLFVMCQTFGCHEFLCPAADCPPAPWITVEMAFAEVPQ